MKSKVVVLTILLFVVSSIFAVGDFTRIGTVPIPQANLNDGGIGNMISGVDIDGDGKTEMYLVNDNWNDGATEIIPRIYKLEYNGTTWDSVWSAVAPVDYQNTWPQLKIADLDGDGKQELIWAVINAGTGNPNRIIVYEHATGDAFGVDTTGGYKPNSVWTIADADGINARPMDMIVEDIDADGVEELIFADRKGHYHFAVCSVDDIPAGSKWLDQIDSALGDSKVFITMCSPNSIIRPWINFETGCAWIKQTPIIPICHSGLSKSNLPQPLSMFQALDLEEEAFSGLLFGALGKHLGVSKLPRIAFDEMLAELKHALSQIRGKVPASQEQATTTRQPRLPEIQEKILQVLSEVGDRHLQTEELAAHFSMHTQKIQYFLDKLVDHNYVYSHLSMMAPTTYSLGKDGRTYIVENNLI